MIRNSFESFKSSEVLSGKMKNIKVYRKNNNVQNIYLNPNNQGNLYRNIWDDKDRRNQRTYYNRDHFRE